MSIEKELELAEHTLREILRQGNHGDPGWVTNRRANIYAVEAEIARLKRQMGGDKLEQRDTVARGEYAR